MAKKTRPLPSSPTETLPVPVEVIERRIYLIRGQKVMLSPDLADLYRVEVRALVQTVKRNLARFPEDFMFQLTTEEYANLKSQIVISSWGGSRRATPYAFTEQGIAMLSSVLRSTQAIQVNIAIMRAFVRVREMMATHKDLARKIDDLERRQKQQGLKIDAVFDAVKKIIATPVPPKRRIGFRAPDDK